MTVDRFVLNVKMCILFTVIKLAKNITLFKYKV